MTFSHFVRCAVALSVAVAVFSVPAAAVESKLVYQNFGEATLGLSPSEVKGLQEIYDDYKVLDLDKSGLVEFSQWLEVLRERLTTAIEGEGVYYPEYRISVLASTERVAFVYKHRLPGQKFYRGHVYLSSSVIDKMINTLEKTPATLEASDLLVLMTGVQGVMTHEFIHPKEDELIKWELREGHDRSGQSHGQADELATDLMAQRLLKKARLDPKSLLIGLDLIFGHKPTRGDYVNRAANALIAVHPEDKLRVNIARGGLVQLRREEGAFDLEPLEFNAELVKEEFGQIISNDSKESRLERIKAEAQARGESVVIRFLNEMLSAVRRPGEDRNSFETGKGYTVYVDWFPLLNQVLAEKPVLSEAESQALLDFFKQIKKDGAQSFSIGLWMVKGQASGGENTTLYSPVLARKMQKLLKDSPLFEVPAIKAFIAKSLADDFWGFTAGKGAGELHYLAVVLPRAQVHQIYAQVLNGIDRFSPERQSEHLSMMLYGFLMMGGDVEVELQAIRKLRELCATSDEAAKAFIERADVLSPGEQVGMRPYYYERFRVAGARRDELVAEWAALYESFVSNPELVLSDEGFFRNVFPGWRIKRDPPFVLGVFHWELVPEDHGKSFLAGYVRNTRPVVEKILKILSNDAWKLRISEVFSLAPGQQSSNEDAEVIRSSLPKFFASTEVAFTQKQREEILDRFLELTESAETGSTVFDERIRFEATVINEIKRNEMNFAARRIIKLSEFIRRKTKSDLFSVLEKVLGTSSDVAKLLFGTGDKTVMLLEALKKSGQIDEQAYELAYERYFFGHVPERGRGKAAGSTERDSAYAVWKSRRPNGSPEESLALVRRLVATFSIQNSGAAQGLVDQGDPEMRKYQVTGIKVSPEYARLLGQIADGLGSDFQKLLGVGRSIKVGDPAFGVALVQNYPKVLDYIKTLFNPDGVWIQVEFQELVKFHHLDELAEVFVPLVSSAALSPQQALEIWKQLAAKRANRHTDSFFEKFVYPHLVKQQEAARTAEYKSILGYGMLRSERLKNELFSEFIKKDLDSFKDHAGSLTDRQVQPLIQKLISRVPNSSRFRDELLEKIAWKLELSEAQLHKFIEPMKSFNFRAFDPLTLNLLSALSLMTEKLSIQEKFDLVSYIQKRKGSLREALPGLDRFVSEVDQMLWRRGFRNFDWLDHLESFVRDAGDGERLVLTEILVGSRGVGLWYQGDVVRDRIYEMAGLEKGSKDRKAFEGYLKALPEYEHSITLSYVLSMADEGGAVDLIKYFDAFDILGDLGAQQASILGIFEPEQSEKLALAKNKASPPTRAKIYELFRKYYTAEEFAKIRRVRKLLGSGKLKYVVLTKFDDGISEAVSIRREFLDERIKSTLEIVRTWFAELEKDPEFAADYDFAYYLQAFEEELKEEVKFKRTFVLSHEMNEMYSGVQKYKGWRFMPIPASKIRKSTDQLLHFMAVENAVPFDELSSEDQVAVSELIVMTEVKLVGRGKFDADRHMGNYLFDSVTKFVYPADPDQIYQLVQNGLFRPGDTYVVARLLQGVNEKNDLASGARAVAKAFVSIASSLPEGADKATLEAELAVDFTAILSSPEPLKRKMLRILSRLNKRRVRIPLRFSMGVIKGLMTVLNEDYAKVAGSEFVKKRLEGFVRTELALGLRFELVESCLNLLKPSDK